MILSIESSCDDSAVALTQISTCKVILHKKISQESEHSLYGGVVPELASRLHAVALPLLLEYCKPYLKEIKAVAVTSSPGLAVTLIEGVVMAKAVSIALDVPLISVNHLIGHIYSLFIQKQAIFPLTVLLVSGGHTQVIEAKGLDEMKVVATTMDDSFGESFDKVAKMMGLGYPGGPKIEALAKKGNRKRYGFTVPLYQSPKIAFSYSGLKNAVRLAVLDADKKDYADIAASFEYTAVAHLTQKLKKYFKSNPPVNFAIVGGASANAYLRSEIQKLLTPFNATLLLTEIEYCSDNAAMIGRVAVEMYDNRMFTDMDELTVNSKSGLCSIAQS